MTDDDHGRSWLEWTPQGCVFSPRADGSQEPRCTSCGISTILAESRLHRGWPEIGGHFESREVLIDVFRAGSTLGCDVCSLVVDAVMACPEATRRAYEERIFRYSIQNSDNEGCKFYLTESRLAKFISIFPAEGILTAWNIQARARPSEDTSSLQAVQTIACWMTECEAEHKQCKREVRPEVMPKRILKLAPGHVQLCEDQHSLAPYACLSHCWGPRGPSLKLDITTVPTMKAGLTLEQLPKTFQDAAVLCLNLGIHYLWIDALCILQGDEDDWKEAAASMANIYEGARITIAATWSNDSTQGCFSRMRNDLRAFPVKKSGLFVQARLPLFPQFPTQGDDDWPLLRRAWVFQERKLSPRVVHLTKSQLHWECNAVFLSENGSKEDPHDIFQRDHLKAPADDPKEEWRTAIRHYSQLELTYKSDRLPAISALVRRMQPLRHEDIYIAGLWLNSLLDDLTWAAALVNAGDLPRRDATCPSWSWVSAACGVYYYVETWRPSVRLVDATYNIIGPAHFGFTSNASIKLEGPSITVRLCDWGKRDHEDPVLHFTVPHQKMEVRAKCRPDFDWKTSEPAILLGESLDVLFMGAGSSTRWGMILWKITEKKYQRVGCIYLTYHTLKQAGLKVAGLNVAKTKNRYEVVEQALDDFIASLPIRQFTIV